MDKAWVDGLTFAEMLHKIVADCSDIDAVVFPQLSLRWSYREFFERIKRLARALMALGVKQGDHVGIWSTNWPEWLLAQFATGYMGAVLVNVNPAYRVHEVDFMLRKADIKVLLLTDTFKHSDYAKMLCELIPELNTRAYDEPLQSERYPLLRHVICIKDIQLRQGIWPWNEFIAQSHQISEKALQALADSTNCSMPSNIQYTSGTTGAPKGATLSQRNVLMNGFYIGECQHITEVDRVCIPVPFYHCFGCVLGTMMSVVHGATMVIPNESFDPNLVLEAVEKERCTALYGVPTMFNAELHSQNFDMYDLSTLRTGIMAGSPCPIELMRQVTQLMHLHELTIAYGLTEASPVITQSQTHESLEIRCTTVGRAMPGVDVRIVNPETLEDVPDGQPGELWCKGHGVMLGYYKDPEATAQVITPDGWLRSGDLAVRLDSGHYRISGRIKEMIIRGGENIYARESEEYLITHPKIYDVQIVGLPDAHYGEQVSAWIIRKDATLTEDEVRAFCKGEIAHYKIPYYITFVDEFPMNVSNKIQKFKLREMGIEYYNLENAAKEETA